MRRVLFLSVLILMLCAACAPAGGQPVFSMLAIPPDTPQPTVPNPRVIASLKDRIASFDVRRGGGVIALATSSAALLYDLQTGRLLRSLNDKELVTAVAWSPDGSRLAVGSSKDYGKPFFTGGDSTNSWKAHLTVYDTASWKVIFEPQFGTATVNQMFYEIAWSPDSRSLAFSMDLGGVQVLDVQTGRVVSKQADFAGTVTAIAWSPDGTRLVANHDMAYAMRRWKVSDNQFVRLFDPRSSGYDALAWSPDGTRIASGDGQGGLCFWTAATNRCDGFVHAHRTATFSLAWSPDSSQLATGGGVIRIWDTNSGELIRAFGEDSSFIYQKLQWLSLDGTLVAKGTSITGSAASVVRLWNISSGSILAEFRGQ